MNTIKRVHKIVIFIIIFLLAYPTVAQIPFPFGNLSDEGEQQIVDCNQPLVVNPQQFPIYVWGVTRDFLYEDVLNCGINTIWEPMRDGDSYWLRSNLIEAARDANINITTLQLNERSEMSIFDKVRNRKPLDDPALAAIIRSFDSNDYGYSSNPFLNSIIKDDLDINDHDLSYYFDVSDPAQKINNSILIPPSSSGLIIEGPKSESHDCHCAIRYTLRLTEIGEPQEFNVKFRFRTDPDSLILSGNIKIEVVDPNNNDNTIIEKDIPTYLINVEYEEMLTFNGDNSAFNDDNPNTYIECRVYVTETWEENNIYLDNITFTNKFGEELINGNLTDEINSEILEYEQQALGVNLLGYYFDEPHVYSFVVLETLRKTINKTFISSSEKSSFFNESLKHLQPDTARFHFYPFVWDNSQNIQNELDLLSNHLFNVNWLCNEFYPNNVNYKY